MRIQLNTLGTCPTDYGVAGIKTKRPYDQMEYYYYIFVAFYCEQCGAELHGSWTSNYFHIRHLSRSQIACNDAEYARLEEAHKQSHKDFERISEEIQAILDTYSCPCCGEKISTDPGYFAVYEYGIRWDMKSYTRKYRYHQAEELGEKYYWKDTDRYKPRLDLDEVYDVMQSFRANTEAQQARETASALIAQYESAAPTDIIPAPLGIKDQPEQLKEHLLKLIHTETNIFSLKKRLENLYALRIEADRAAYGSTLGSFKEAKVNIEASQLQLEQYQNTLLHLNSKQLAPIELPMPKRPQKPTEPQYALPGLFNKKRVLAENAEQKAKYEEAYYQYEVDLDIYSQELAARERSISQLFRQQAEQHQREIEKAQHDVREAEQQLIAAQQKHKELSEVAAELATPEKAYKMLLDQEISQAENLLQETICCKHKLYNHNIVFGKYRNITAISTFYEYLMAGRCTSLEGTDGAYNLYESELRANIIIGKLDTVIKSLESIRNNQYTIYSSIQNVNASLRRLENSMSTMSKSLKCIDSKTQTMTDYMKKVAKNSDVIAHNTAVTAYYSKINAELTNALGYMVALK